MRRAFRRDNRSRMAIECDDNGNGFVLLRVGNGLANNLLVAEMNAVEHANRDADFALAGVEFVGRADDVHGFTIYDLELTSQVARFRHWINWQSPILKMGSHAFPIRRT